MEEILNELQLRRNEIRELDVKAFGIYEHKIALVNQCMALENLIGRIKAKESKPGIK